MVDGVFLLAVAASSKHVHRVPNHYRGVGESGRRGSAADVQLLPATELQHLLRAGHLDSHSKKGVSTPAIDLQPKKLRACGSELSFALLHLWWALNRTEHLFGNSSAMAPRPPGQPGKLICWIRDFLRGVCKEANYVCLYALRVSLHFNLCFRKVSTSIHGSIRGIPCPVGLLRSLILLQV